MNKLITLIAIGLLLLPAACSPPAHQGELSAFDGTTYDTLIVGRQTIVSLSEYATSKQSSSYYPDINTAIAAFNATEIAYKFYHDSNGSGQTNVASDVAALTLAVVNLESEIQQNLHAPASVVASATTSVMQKKHVLGLAKAHVSIIDILSGLQIAATIAATIPEASPYAALAEVIIDTASKALASYQAAQGAPIDLTVLTPIPLLNISGAAAIR